MAHPAHRPNPDSEPPPTPPAGPAARDLTGRVLADFQVERLLGHGGMGEVYRARQLSLDRPVALKVLRAELVDNPAEMARFESEAWAAARINHPNIVHIYTLGGVDGVRFIAMEYVEGTSLRVYLARKGVPELPLALSIMRQAGQAIGAAGEQGLIHRDIKPDNLLLTRKGQVKVADFGLCRVSERQLSLTQSGTTVGTPLYMSPEQVQGHSLDHRSDLYSLGVTFYHMLAGVPPFQAETPVALALKHIREKPVSLAVHRPDLPPELVALVMKLLAKDPAERYQSAAEMLRDLARVKEQVQAGAGTEPRFPTVGPPGGTGTQATVPLEIDQSGDQAGPVGTPAEGAGARPGGPGWGLSAITLGLAALAGAGWGWRDRPRDLLAPGAPAPSAMPALGMDNWQAVPALPGALAQYRLAQTGVADDQRVAAWLAVPARFPGDGTVSYRAYTQLARELFRRGDAERLDSLAQDLASSPQTRSEQWQSLAHISTAASAAVAGDAGRLLDAMRPVANLNLLDPGAAELALEALVRVQRGPGTGKPESAPLAKLRASLLEVLGLDHPALRLSGPGPEDRLD